MNMTLQINSNGAWRNVVKFEAPKRDDVVAGLHGLAYALGEDVKWCLLLDDGKRDRLQFEMRGLFPGWDDVTPTAPAPHVDVMVSVWDEIDAQAHVYMAYRSSKDDPDRWLISGTEEPLPFKPYAFGPIVLPATRNNQIVGAQSDPDAGVTAGENRTTSGWIGQP